MNDAARARTPRRRALALAVGAWLLAGAVLVATALAARDYLSVEEARAPELTGLPVGEATRLAEEAGLELRSYPVEARGVDPDVVVEQSPPAGTIVRTGRAVAVGVHVLAEDDRMPALVGVAEEDAVASLRGLGLPSPDVAYRTSDGPRGQVVEQEPSAGTAVGPDETVRLTVSRGPEQARVELPDLEGLDVESAETQLAALGVRRVETVAVEVSMLRPGTVVRQRPDAGSVVNVGEPVLLGYALEGSRVARVPDVAGLEPWRARVALRSAGLELGPVERVDRPDEPRGVIEARPSGLTVAGSPVTLVINAAADAPLGIGDRDPLPDLGRSEGDRDDRGDGAAERPTGDEGRSVPFRFDPRELGVRSLIEREYELRLVVRDAEGERTVLDRRVGAGETVRTTVVVRGDEPLLQTYVNGVFFQAWRP